MSVSQVWNVFIIDSSNIYTFLLKLSEYYLIAIALNSLFLISLESPSHLKNESSNTQFLNLKYPLLKLCTRPLLSCTSGCILCPLVFTASTLQLESLVSLD
jgi:hypothetical protein